MIFAMTLDRKLTLNNKDENIGILVTNFWKYIMLLTHKQLTI